MRRVRLIDPATNRHYEAVGCMVDGRVQSPDEARLRMTGLENEYYTSLEFSLPVSGSEMALKELRLSYGKDDCFASRPVVENTTQITF